MEDLKGRTASFHFSNDKKITGSILHVPVATGDSWVIDEIYEGRKFGNVVYIQQFDYMYLSPPKE